MYHNLKKARRGWAMFTRVLAKTGATVQYHGMMYKAVYQSVLNCTAVRFGWFRGQL